MEISFDTVKEGDTFINSRGNHTTIINKYNKFLTLKSELGTEWNMPCSLFNTYIRDGRYTNFTKREPKYTIAEALNIEKLAVVCSSKEEYDKLKAVEEFKVCGFINRVQKVLYLVNRHTWNYISRSYKYNTINFNQLILINSNQNGNKSNESNAKRNSINSESRTTGQGNVIISTARRYTAVGSRQIGNIQTAKYQRTRINTSQIKGSILSI